ncbi:MAG: HDOD domain-containing protein [Helicobacteraceae bacterium]|nr:HDOD domain-containing protein [Helicobacteraceae bacterium]
MKDKLLEKIKQLPPLPESAIKIEAIYQDPESSFMDMVKVLESDPLLTADILKAANSPLYGFSREINSIERAVSLFGMGAIRGFALASIVKKSFKLDLSAYGITNDQFASLSQNQVALVNNWYAKIDRLMLNVLSPASFLVEIGKALIAQIIIESGDKDAFKAMIVEGKIKEAEVEFIEIDTAEASATIFDHWRFEDSLISTIRYCSDPSKAPDPETKTRSAILQAVRIAIPLNGVVTDESSAEAVACAKANGLDDAALLDAINNMREVQDQD